MASLLNECYFRATSAGTGDFVVSSAIAGFYTPAQCTNPAVTNGAVYFYRAESDDLTQYESGCGAYTTGTSTLARTTVLQSSNAGAKVNFTAAPKVRIVALSHSFEPVQSMTPGGRLTLTSGTPVLSSDVSGATTLYYALYKHDCIPVFDGSIWRPIRYTELSLALDNNSGHTGYHQSGKNFDVFYAYVSGTLYFGTGPAWTSDTARSAALGRKDGVLTNDASMTLRHGSAAGDTVTVPANQGLYLGTMRATDNGQCSMIFGGESVGGTAGLVGLWNCYNRTLVRCYVADATDNWTYNSTTFRAANDSSTARVSFVLGLSEDVVEATYFACAKGGTTAVVAVGLDTLTTRAGTASFTNSGAPTAMLGAYKGLPGIGYHFVAPIENANGTCTFYGDAAQVYLQTGFYVTLWA